MTACFCRDSVYLFVRLAVKCWGSELLTVHAYDLMLPEQSMHIA